VRRPRAAGLVRVLPHYFSIVSLKGISATTAPASSAGHRLLVHLIKISELDTLGVNDGVIVVNDAEKVVGHNRTTTHQVFFRQLGARSAGRVQCGSGELRKLIPVIVNHGARHPVGSSPPRPAGRRPRIPL
jgi:hypothetical protein